MPANGTPPPSAPLPADKQVKITQYPSTNYGPRRGVFAPRFIMIHYTAMQSAKAALERLCDPIYELSAHYLIADDGCIYQLVPEGARAWHAGAGDWEGLTDMNSHSIGIELDNLGDCHFTEPLMHSLEMLLTELMQAWDIPAQNIIGHSDYAPTRKYDPGPLFDWARLEKKGLAARSTIA